MSETFDAELEAGAQATIGRLAAEGLTIAIAESCTGGLIAAALTAIAGSSAVVERGFVTYSNRAKIEMLGVPEDVIARFGAVSAETAQAMVEGVLAHSPADIAVAVTGIAGPSGGSAEKPVGLVHIAALRCGHLPLLHHEVFPGDRCAVRRAAALTAFKLVAALFHKAHG